MMFFNEYILQVIYYILFTGHVLCHDIKYMCFSAFSTPFITNTPTIFSKRKQAMSEVFFDSISHNQNSLIFCASICPFKGGSTLFH